jgi:hypothetical protein
MPLVHGDLLFPAETAGPRRDQEEMARERLFCAVSEDPGGFEGLRANLGVICAVSA